jgi:hypothetical protein
MTAKENPAPRTNAGSRANSRVHPPATRNLRPNEGGCADGVAQVAFGRPPAEKRPLATTTTRRPATIARSSRAAASDERHRYEQG